MRRILALFLMFHASFAWGAFEKTEVVNGITWTYSFAEDGVKLGYHTTEPKMLTVTAINKSTTGSITIPAALNGRNVTQIGVAAFGGCSNLTSVTIPFGVKIIDDSAFSGCVKLKTITIPGSVKSIGDYAFNKCSSLTGIQIPNSVTNIGEGAFRKCSSLESVVFPSPLKNIPKSMFEDCVGLKSIDIPNGITNICDSAFVRCTGLTRVSVADSVASIESGAFSGCSSLKDVVIGSGVKYIGTAAFINCHSIENISLNDWTRLDIGAFRGCSKLRSIEIPSATSIIRDHTFCDCSNLVSVTALDASSIEEYAFANCINLKSVEINARKVGDKAFYCCSGLTNIVFSSQLSSIGAQAFSGCSGFADLLLPDGTKSIGKWAFRDCDNLKNVVIGKGLESFGSAPFYDCNSIEHLTIPQLICSIGSNGVAKLTSDFVASTPKSLTSIVVHEGVVSIANSTFGNCYSLRSVLIPESVVSIEPYAFYYCHYYYGLIDESHFSCDNLQTIYIPKNYKGSLPYLSLSVPSGLVECRYNPHQVVSLDANDGTVSPSSLSVKFASPYGNLPTPVRTGYDFSGWMYREKCVNSNTPVAALDDHTLTAQWTPKRYQVSFDSNGGDGGWNREMEYGAAIVPPTVTRVGYTFAGWTPSVSATVPAENVSYIAQWAANRYTVKFDANGGEGVMDDVTCVYDGETLSLTNCFTRLGYSVVGWATSADGDMVYPVGQSVENIVSQNGGMLTLYAIWILNKYHVTFDASGGNGGWSELMDYGTAIVPPTVVREGHTFAGWSPAVPATVPAGNVTYTAQWSVNKYAVTFDANGGEGGWSQQMEYGTELMPPTVVWGDYTFTGWSPSVPVTVPASNVTYVAQWGHLPVFTIVNGWLKKVDPKAENDIVIPDGVKGISSYAFRECTGITSVTIPDGVTRIEENAFYRCSGIASITMPDSIVRIDRCAFYGCSGLTAVYISNLDAWFRISFGGYQLWGVHNLYLNGKLITEIAFPDGMKHAGDYALEGCSSITNVMIPASLESIGGGLFENCIGLTRITIPNSVTSIGWGAFSGCSALTSVTIPDRVTSIEGELFRDCSGLTSVTIPDSVTSIGWGAFYGCDGLASIEIPDSVKSVGDDAFSHCVGLTNVTIGVLGKRMFDGCTNIASVTILDGVKNIGDNAFSGYTNLVSVTIPDSVTNIGERAFLHCEHLAVVTIPDGVENIGRYAFYECNALKHVSFGRSVKSIGKYAFYYCDLESVVFDGDAPVVETPCFFRSTAYVHQSASGFDVAPSERWNGLAIEYIEKVVNVVTFDANGGTGGWNRAMEYGAAIVPPTVTRAGYTFIGWSPSVATTVPVGGASYTAQWKVNQYTVTFDANGGTGGKSVTQNYGTALCAPTVSRTGYTFKGWSPTVPAAVPAGNATYVAQWQINKYTVTFNANGGTGGWSRSMEYGAAIMPPTVTRTGYTFIGWSSAVAGAVPAGNITYTAQWKVNQYTVTFDANGGEGGTSVTQDYGTSLVAPVVTRTGYTFKGWSPSVPAKFPAGNATYVAQWEINKYTATLELNGGDGDELVVVEYGTRVGEIPMPMRTGHTFAGWFTASVGGEQVPDDEEITGDTTLYAQWTVNKYAVTFDANGGDGGTSVTQDYGTALAAPMVTRTGYTFKGWSPVVPATVPAENATYVAQWEIIKYTVTFNANGGSLGSANRIKSVTYGGTCGELPTPKRDYYAFLGWFTTADGGDGITAETAFYDDATLYAHWRYVETGVDIAPAYETSADGTFTLDLQELLVVATMPKLTFKGLPTGLKYDAKKSVVSGKATKPGVYKVTVSATNATVKKPVTAEFEIVVPNLRSEVLPNLAQDKDAYGVVMCGVAIDPKLVNCKPEGGWTVKAAGLPSGLKYDAKTGKITGVPTKAGTFTVTFTATKGKEKQTATITLKTEALPTWATGAFAGYVNAGDDYGSATMTVAANGKVSGKIVLGGTNWTFSAASFSRVEGLNDARTFVIEAEAKSGKATKPVVLTVGGAAAPLVNAVAEGTFGNEEMKLWRNIWKDKATASEAKATIEEFVGVYTVSIADGADYGSGYMSLTVGKDGNVKASGKLADGTSASATSPLMYDENEGWFAMLYAAPSAYKGGAFAAAVGFEEAVAGRPPYRLAPVIFAPQWSSRNMQATGDYGKGFVREVNLVGAYYNKLETLRKYYESLWLGLGGAPELGFTYKETSLDEQGRKATTSSAATAQAADTLWQDGTTASVNDKGAIVVAKATKPVQDRKTKEWSYDGANDGGLTLSFTQATGIFKGSYTFWYDYVSAYDETTDKETMAHTSKKVNFEGILVQGEEPKMEGFYLWDATGAYEDEKTGKPKTYKFKQSFPVWLFAQ